MEFAGWETYQWDWLDLGARQDSITFGEPGTEETGDLLDERVRRNERVVFSGKFLDQFLVLVQLL